MFTPIASLGHAQILTKVRIVRLVFVVETKLCQSKLQVLNYKNKKMKKKKAATEI